MLNFDWSSFYKDLKDAFVSIRSVAIAELPHLQDSQVIFPYELAYDIILSHAQKSDAYLKSPNRSNTALEVACQVITTYIDTGANSDKYSTAAFRQSSGRIPKDLRPRLKKLDPTTLPASPTGDRLAAEESAFIHATASSRTVHDPKGSTQKFK